jgi:hypothetical protein
MMIPVADTNSTHLAGEYFVAAELLTRSRREVLRLIWLCAVFFENSRWSARHPSESICVSFSVTSAPSRPCDIASSGNS